MTARTLTAMLAVLFVVLGLAAGRASAQGAPAPVDAKLGPEGDLMTAIKSGVVLSDDVKKAMAESGDPKDCIGQISKPCEDGGGKACEAREARGWEQAIRELRSASMKPLAAARAAALARSSHAHAERLCAATARVGKESCKASALAKDFIAVRESDRL